MKTFKLVFVMISYMVVVEYVSPQTVAKASGSKTETFKVWGNYDLCKVRIEKAVMSDGATTTEWNIKTTLLTVTFDPDKTGVDAFSKKLDAVGHDTEKYRAEDKAYEALDACCKYERRK